MDQPYQPDDYDYKYPPSVASSRTFTDDKYEPNRLEPLLYDNTSAHSDETRTSKASQRTRRRITGADATVAFHAALILQYLILIVIWIPHWEHRTTIGLSKRSDMLRAMVTQLQALVAATYSTLLVFMTQRQALRVHLSVQQTLTSLHDCLTAWIGLGSALLVVGYQAKLSSGARNAVVAITAYLVSIFAYHTVAPTLFDLSPYNATEPVGFDIRYHRPNELLYDLPFDFLRSMAMFPTMSTPGLFQDKIVYDIIADNTASQYGVGYLNVNETGFGTDCSLIPGSQTGYSNSTSNEPTWNISLEDGRTYSMHRTRPATVRILPVPLDANGRNATSQNVTVMLSSPLLLRPQSGRRMAENSTAALTPNMTFDDLPHNQTGALSFLTCAIKYTDGFTTINTDNRYFSEIIDADLPLQKLSRHPWEHTWSRLMSWGFPQNSTWNPSSPTFNQSSSLSSPAPTLSNTEILLLRTAGISSWGDDPDSPDVIIQSPADYWTPQQFHKYDIESYLASTTAKMYWIAANVAQPVPDQITSPWSAQAAANGVMLNTRLRLNINTVALFVGLAASIAATALSRFLIRPPKNTEQVPIPRAIDSAGLLQWTHLLSDGGQTERVFDIEQPTVANLRSAGMKVPWEGLRRRT